MCAKITIAEARKIARRIQEEADKRRGEAAEKDAAETRAAFDAMADDQQKDYEDYVRRCGGVPISTIRP